MAAFFIMFDSDQFKRSWFPIRWYKGEVMTFNFNKFRSFCRKFRIALGTVLIGYAVYSGNNWFYLGILPLAAGIANFCPTCIISKKCDLPEQKAKLIF